MVLPSFENKEAPQSIVLDGQEMANSEQTSHQVKPAVNIFLYWEQGKDKGNKLTGDSNEW